MTLDLVANAVRGTMFGGALTAAGVYSPQIILDQMSLRDFHMMKVFLTASASSALILAAFRSQCKPRQAANLGRFGPYDGNIIGGAMIGAGMALTGACPGTVFVQVAAGVPSALPVFLGSILGGIVYVQTAPRLQAEATKREVQDKNNLTVGSRLKIDQNIVLLAYEAVLVSAIVAFTKSPSTQAHPLNPILGGLAVGFSQLASVLLTGQTLGISGAFEEMGKWTWWIVDRVQHTSPKQQVAKPKPKPSTSSIQFAATVMLGTYLCTTLRPEFAISGQQPAIAPLVGFLGGFVMIFGSRLAGGCTSGHGISGMSMLSVSSIISVASMFGAGIGLGLLLY